MTPQLLETASGAWFALLSCLLVLFGRYILIEYRAGRPVKAAVAIFVYLLGAWMARGYALLWWSFSIRGEYIHVFLLGNAIAIIGALMIMRVFTPQGCGEKGWIVSGALACLAAGLLALF